MINQIPFKSGIINRLSAEIGKFLDKGDLIPVNREATAFTTPHYLKAENAVAQLITSLNAKESGLTSSQVNPLTISLVKNNTEVNFVNVKGDANHHLSAISQIQTLAKENRQPHIIVVPNGAAAITKVVQLLPNTPEQISTQFEKRLKQGDFIAIDGSLNTLMGNFIEKTTVERESLILKQILKGKNTQLPLIKTNQAINTAGLTQGQQKAAEKILRSSDQIIAIQGYAGVGKTTQFKTVAKSLKQNRPDITLIGLAPTKRWQDLKKPVFHHKPLPVFLMKIMP